MNMKLLIRKLIKFDRSWIWRSWSESSLCPTVHESEALDQKVHYVRRFMNLKLLVRTFIMSDGSWIWRSWSESSLCPTVHESDALGQKVQYARRFTNLKLLIRKFIKVDGPRIWSSWSESSLSPTVHESEALVVRKFIMSDRSWIWSQSLLCSIVHWSVQSSIVQKVHRVRSSMNLKLHW